MTISNDCVMRFSFVDFPVRGQWVRLDQVMRDATRFRTYPPAIHTLLGQMLGAVSMFADNLKFDGAVALQSKGNGALLRSLAECRDRQFLRGIAHLNEDIEAPESNDFTAWLARGQLALSLIPANEIQQQTYQGMINLEQPSLQANLEHYFDISEQLPTRLYFAHNAHQHTALLLQRLPNADLATEVMIAAADEAWHTIQTLADTVTEPELATLPAQDMIRRLFAEYSVRLSQPRQLQYRCTCSRRKTDRTLATFSTQELHEILQEQGEITVDCEFCGQRYRYDAVDVAELTHQGRSGTPNTLH